MTACPSLIAGFGASMKRRNRKRSDRPEAAVSGSMAGGFSSLPTHDRRNGLPSLVVRKFTSLHGAALGSRAQSVWAGTEAPSAVLDRHLGSVDASSCAAQSIRAPSPSKPLRRAPAHRPSNSTATATRPMKHSVS